ncbi:peptide-methionine (S)-S-oxide reductase MsrA [Streptomyces sp. NPDC101209]|uniref:peptide-methionine (S)-S-oxide reductase MsrA n=1 Tax=Streptomyces sp. NPDC101209 TaxID=3366129 RepID=UPI0037F238B9
MCGRGRPFDSSRRECDVLVGKEKVILAGGCFWGVQELFRTFPGVVETRVGYIGGEVVNPTYRNHGSHAEGVEITFDSSVTSLRAILEFFFQIHDPTTLNKQGDAVGTSYRSAIFYLNERQRGVAERVIADIGASELWPGELVTEVVPAGTFWPAEPEHQDYLQRHPNGYSCHYVREDWRLPNDSV